VKAEHVHHPHARQCGREEIRALVGDRADKEGSAVHPNFAAKLLEEQTTAPPSLRRQAAFLLLTAWKSSSMRRTPFDVCWPTIHSDRGEHDQA
jgi:hypothetical protein